jgi:Flp pilus assembly protein TadD
MWRTVKAYYPDFNRYPELARGRSAYANGEFREARALLEKALARRQPAHDVHVYLGLTLQALGDDALAVQHLRTALALAPDSALHWHLAAKGHIQGRRFEEARAAIARQRELAPGEAAPLRQLATLELEASNVDAARAVLDTLLEASPGDVESLVLRGVVSHLLGEVAEARRYYERALAAQPANADARRNLERLGVPVSAAQ